MKEEITVLIAALNKAPLSQIEAYAVNNALAKIEQALKEQTKSKEDGNIQKEIKE